MPLPRHLILNTPVVSVTIDRLATYLKVIRLVEQTLLVSGIIVAASVVLQLAYPRGLTRPFARMDSVSIGFQSAAKLNSRLQVLDDKTRVIVIGSSDYKLSLAEVGIHTDPSATVNNATAYPLRERLVPLSLFKKVEATPVRRVDQNRLNASIHKLVTANTKPPANPSVDLTPDGFRVKPGTAGIIFNEAAIKEKLVNIPAYETTLKSQGQIIKPTVDEKKLNAVVKAVNQQSNQQFTVNVQGQAYVATADKIRLWSRINVDAASGAITTAYDLDSIKAWLAASVPATLKAPTPTRNTVIDNVLVQSQPGQAGTAVDQTKTATLISQALTDKATAAVAPIVTLPSPVQTSRSFSATSQGLTLLINQWSKAHAGMVAGVAFKELGGQSRSATLNPDRQFVSASIYKLFTTLYLTREIASGHIVPTTEIIPGKSIADCMEAMIVVSDNACPVAVGNTYGWAAIDSLAKSQGFTATSLNGSLLTTPGNVADYLTALANGNLMSASDTSALLDRMQRQIYRSAIPAGSPGCTVADKVGFIDNYWHDAAIVTCPHTTYVLVVFTQNGGAQAIRELAGQISSLVK